MIVSQGSRSSYSEAASRGTTKNGVFQNFAKFTGKHLFQSLFFIISLIFIKKEVTLSQVPSSAFCETNSSFLAEHLLVTASGY